MIGPTRPGPVVGTITTSGATGGPDDWTSTGPVVALTWELEALWVDADPGLLQWDCSISADANITAAWLLTCGANRRRTSRGPGAILASTLAVRPGDLAATAVLTITCPPATSFTLDSLFGQVEGPEARPTAAIDGFGDVSTGGVPPPDPPAGMPAREAGSPARRSPQVREAQRRGTGRPDLLPRQSSLR